MEKEKTLLGVAAQECLCCGDVHEWQIALSLHSEFFREVAIYVMKACGRCMWGLCGGVCLSLCVWELTLNVSPLCEHWHTMTDTLHHRTFTYTYHKPYIDGNLLEKLAWSVSVIVRVHVRGK